jgi:hypothetical protein
MQHTLNGKLNHYIPPFKEICYNKIGVLESFLSSTNLFQILEYQVFFGTDEVIYKKPDNLGVVGYSDPDYNGCLDSIKSMSVYLFTLSG